MKFLFTLMLCWSSFFHSSGFETHQNLQLFSDVFRYIRQESARPVSDAQLIAFAIQGMLSGVDDCSMYISPEKYQEILRDFKGHFGGIGIEFAVVNGKVTVLSPIDHSPAANAGVLAGDHLLELNGESVRPLSLSEIRDKLKGQIGEIVILKVLRKNRVFTFTIKRSKIVVQALSWQIVDDILYIRIALFNKKVSQDLRALLGRHFVFKGVLLDLRNNPGGVLEEAVNVTNIFLETGRIVSVKSRNPKKNKNYDADSRKVLLPKKPLIVLINKGTASSAEIVAAALRENGRAVLVGEKTFGKASVQTIVPIPPGYSAVQLTTGLYCTPSGKSIDRIGIMPDVYVSDETRLAGSKDPLYAEAMRLLKKKGT